MAPSCLSFSIRLRVASKGSSSSSLLPLDVLFTRELKAGAAGAAAAPLDADADGLLELRLVGESCAHARSGSSPQGAAMYAWAWVCLCVYTMDGTAQRKEAAKVLTYP